MIDPSSKHAQTHLRLLPRHCLATIVAGTALLLGGCGSATPNSGFFPLPSVAQTSAPTEAAVPSPAEPVEVLGRASDLPDIVEPPVSQETVAWSPPAEGNGDARLAADFTLYIADAVRDHPFVQTARSARGVADAIIEEAEAARYPELSLGLSGRGILTNRVSVSGGDSAEAGRVRQDFRTDANLRVSQLIYDFGATDAQVEAARQRGAVSQEELRLAISELLLEAVAAHATVLQWRHKSALAEENLRDHELLLEQVEDRVVSGAEPQSTLLLARSRLSDARATAIEASGALDQASATYRRIFARPIEEMPPIDPVPEPHGLPSAIDEALALAERGNPALRAQRSAVLAAQQSHHAAQAGRLPQIRLEAQATQYDVLRRGTGLYDVTGGLVFGHELLGFAEAARTRQALERRRQAEAAERGALLDTQRQVVSLFTEILANASRREALTASVEANLDRLEAYDEQFRIGRRSLIELLDVRSDLFQARTQLVDQEIGLAIARYRLLHVTGALPGAFGIDP